MKKTSRCRVLIAPTVEEKVPGVHGKGKHIPAKGHCVPAGQTSQEVDAEFRAYWPAEHAVHAVEPGTDVKDPDSQGASMFNAEEFVNCA